MRDETRDEVRAWFAALGQVPLIEDRDGAPGHTMWGHRYVVHLRRIGEAEPWLPDWAGGATPDDALRNAKRRWIEHG
jgi:hypothetical protein